MQELISIIVPIYNAEKYLNECIDSIINQTYKSVEVILINDGSTDRSGEICSAWQKKDKRIKYIHQENAGVSAARNLGLKEATGQYIAFVDADDFIDQCFCEKMIDIMQSNDVDMVFCQYMELYEDGKSNNCGGNSGCLVKIHKSEYEYEGNKERRVVWGALYKADAIKGLSFSPELSVGEDTLFLARAINESNYIAYYDEPMYRYRIQSDSAYFGTFNAAKSTEIEAWMKVCEVFESNSLTRLSADAECARTALDMMKRYAGDPAFEKKYAEIIICVYRNKMPQLLAYERAKNRGVVKYILKGSMPHLFINYRALKNRNKEGQ